MSKRLAGALANRVIHFAIKNRDAAKKIADHVVKNHDDCIILPFIDHPGPLTEEILSRNFKSLTICESDELKRGKFQQHVRLNNTEKNVHLYPDDLFDLSYKTHSDTAQQRCATIVRESLQVSTPIGDRRHRDMTVKLLVPLLKSRQHAYLNAPPKENMRLYRSSTVLYNTVFNLTTLESFDLKTNFGITVRKLQNTAAINNLSYQSVHLVRFEPKLEVIDEMSPRPLVEYRFLVTQMMHKRTGLVYDFLNRFFNDFKRDLKQFHIDEQTRCGDLSREQYYQLFRYLKSRPDYYNSTFLQAVASYDDTILSM